MNFNLKDIVTKLGEALFLSSNASNNLNTDKQSTLTNTKKSNEYKVANDSKHGQNMISPKASLIEMMRKHDDIAKKIKSK